MRLGNWFDAHTHTPAQPGVYQRAFGWREDLTRFQYWTGTQWNFYCGEVGRAATFKDDRFRSSEQGGTFRGVLR